MSEVTVSVKLTPAQLAEQFWHMADDEQAAFFAELNRIAGWKLDLQLAYVTRRIAESPDHDAMLGLEAFAGYAQNLPSLMLDIRIDNAKRAA
jgi:hypothetical protein